MTRGLGSTILTLGLSIAALSSQARADDWTGPYIGVGGGYGIASEDLHFSPGPLVGGVVGFDGGIDGLGSKGGFVSITAGYDHRLNRSLVAGLFVDYDFSDIDGQASLSVPGLLGASADFQIENQLSIGGRLGVVLSPSTMIFGTAGYAHVETSNIDFDAAAGGFAISGVLAGVPSFDGFFLGGGIETKIGHGLSIKAEYRYTDLEPEKIDLIPGSGLGAVITTTLEPVIQTGRVSLNYRFGDHDNSVAEDTGPVISKSWTGAYGSIGMGYGAADDKLSISNQPILPPFNATIDGLGLKGSVFGVGGGYDVQSGKFVIGALADWQYDRLENNASLGLAVPAVLGLGVTGHTSIDDMFMGGLRLGYLTNPDTLVFASAGYANAGFGDATFSASVGPPAVNIAGTLIEGKRFDGFFIGGGIETRLSDSLSLKAEYRYVDFGSENVTLLPGLLPIVNALVSTEVDPTMQTGMISLVYRFGHAEAPAPLK